MEWLNEFFKNPSWIGFLAVLAVLIYMLTRDYMKQKNDKKEKENQQKKDNETIQRQEISYKTIDRLADELQRLNDREVNKVNIMTAEHIISSKLNESKGVIKEEIRRIFAQNHRENAIRQKIIKQSVTNLTISIFQHDIKLLNSIYYKNRRLSEFLTNIDNETFFNEMIKLLFTTGGNPQSELQDILMYIDSQFNLFILQGKKYYNNL